MLDTRKPCIGEHRAALVDGSLRDGLSLLDQAIAYSGANTSGNGGGTLDEAGVNAMLVYFARLP
jgi:hypothetical protein